MTDILESGGQVLYLSPYFWPEEIGSAPYCTELAMHLALKGAHVRVIAFRPHYPSAEPFLDWADGSRDFETHAGCAVERSAVTSRGAGGFRERLRNDLRYLSNLIRSTVLGRYKHTAVIVAYVPSTLTLFGARLVGLLTGAPVLAIVHDIESGLAASLRITKSSTTIKLMRAVERWGFGFAQHIVVLTEGMKAELIKIGCSSPMTVIPIWGEPGPSVPINPNVRPVVMYSGNFGKKQNIDQLLPLLERLHESGREVDVVMRGDGSERDRIAAEVAARNITNVQFLPLVPANAFMEVLQSANLHLVPQATNVANYALPSKMFSIMSSGRPFVCIAQVDSPLDELANRSNAGLCIAPGEDARLFDAVCTILDDQKLQVEMGGNGREFVRTYMDKATVLEQFTALIRGLKAPRKS